MKIKTFSLTDFRAFPGPAPAMFELDGGELGIGVLHLPITLLSFGFSQLVFPFLYNRQCMNRMFVSGWRLDDTDPNYELAKQTLGIRRPL